MHGLSGPAAMLSNLGECLVLHAPRSSGWLEIRRILMVSHAWWGIWCVGSALFPGRTQTEENVVERDVKRVPPVRFSSLFSSLEALASQ
jgi:hypothetical protein